MYLKFTGNISNQSKMIVFILPIVTLFCADLPFTRSTNETDALDTLEATHGKIIHASVLFRHGERSLLYSSYPNDPYPWSMLSAEGFGQLTKEGKQRMYELGKWFRARYNKTGLYQGYKFDMLMMNSSDLDRTLMSAEVFLAGLLPPNEDEMWADDGLKWQPIPVHAKPYDEDEVIGLKSTNCERYNLEVDSLDQSSRLQNYYQQNEKLFKFLASKSGLEISTDDIMDAIFGIGQLYDDLLTEELYNLTLPSWTDSVYPTPLDSVYVMSFLISVLTPDMKRLHAGPLVGSLVSDMIQKRNGSFNQVFHFYSGHDSTIAVLLLALDVFNYINPPYGCSVMVELRLKDTEHIVTILYRNDTNHAPYLLTIPQCGHVCTLDKFVEITKSIIPENWKEECEVGFFERVFDFDKTILTVFIYIIYFVIIALGLLAAYLTFRLLKRSSEYNKIT